jgi:hypothetical protein
MQEQMTVDIEKSLEDRDKYYHSYPVLRNITTLLRFRYFAFANRDLDKEVEFEVNGNKITKKIPHMNRYDRGHHHIEFFKVYDRHNFKKSKYLRLYMCLTKLKTSFPVMPSFGEEREKIKKEIVKNLSNYVEGYDMAWDFDIPDNNKKNLTIFDLQKQVLEFIKFFDDYKVSYSVTFSGRRGFHVRIPNDYLHPIIQKKYELIQDISHKIELFHNTLSFHLVRNDLMKLWKLPYSVDGQAPNFYVALPLTIEQLKNFDLDKMRMSYVIRNIKLLDPKGNPRLECMHNFTTMEEQHQNILNMYEDIKNW